MISAVIMLVSVAALAFTPPAFAKSWDPSEECAYWGGLWVSAGENSGSCEYSPDHK
jgi:hypothetical protein